MNGAQATLFRGGSVFDGTAANGLVTADLLVEDGTIAAMGQNLQARDAEILDVTGRIVSAGLVDLHVHCFAAATSIGLSPADAAFTRGVVACADAGSAGASSFDAFRQHIVEPSAQPVFAFLNVSVLGLVDIRHGELLDPLALRADDIERVATENPGIVRGLKVRLSENVLGGDALETLDAAIAAAERVNLPLMVHIGNTGCSLSDIVDRLRSGDIVTHVYTPARNGILENGAVLPAVRRSRERGVLYEIGHGRTQIDYTIARIALAEGFAPDIISTDISKGNWHGPSFDLATVGAKFVSLGMSLPAVLEAMTLAPAKVLGIEGAGFGSLTLGQPAQITVLEHLDDHVSIPDSSGNPLIVQRLEPVASYSNGQLVPTVEWRGTGVLEAAHP